LGTNGDSPDDDEDVLGSDGEEEQGVATPEKVILPQSPSSPEQTIAAARSRVQAAEDREREIRRRISESRLTPDCGITVKEWFEVLDRFKQKYPYSRFPFDLRFAAPKRTEDGHLALRFRSREACRKVEGYECYIDTVASEVLDRFLGVTVRHDESIPGPDPVLKQQLDEAAAAVDQENDILADLEKQQQRQSAWFATQRVTDDNERDVWKHLGDLSDDDLLWIEQNRKGRDLGTKRFAGMAKKVLMQRR
jgi:hypothetical protein